MWLGMVTIVSATVAALRFNVYADAPLRSHRFTGMCLTDGTVAAQGCNKKSVVRTMEKKSGEHLAATTATVAKNKKRNRSGKRKDDVDGEKENPELTAELQTFEGLSDDCKDSDDKVCDTLRLEDEEAKRTWLLKLTSKVAAEAQVAETFSGDGGDDPSTNSLRLEDVRAKRAWLAKLDSKLDVPIEKGILSKAVRDEGQTSLAIHSILKEDCNVVLTHTNADFDSLAGAGEFP